MEYDVCLSYAAENRPFVDAVARELRRRSVRVFYDGFEMPALDPRSRGVLDLTQVNLWSAEEVVVEQAPEEVRVYLRSWRVRKSTATPPRKAAAST